MEKFCVIYGNPSDIRWYVTGFGWLDNEDWVLGYIPAKTQRSFVLYIYHTIESNINRYNLTRGHPIYKLRNKNANDLVVFSTSFSRDTIPDFQI